MSSLSTLRVSTHVGRSLIPIENRMIRVYSSPNMSSGSETFGDSSNGPLQRCSVVSCRISSPRRARKTRVGLSGASSPEAHDRGLGETPEEREAGLAITARKQNTNYKTTPYIATHMQKVEREVPTNQPQNTRVAHEREDCLNFWVVSKSFAWFEAAAWSRGRRGLNLR